VLLQKIALLNLAVFFSVNTLAGCYSMDDCFDVAKNDYTIIAEGYTVQANGKHLPTGVNWEIILIKQQDSGYVRGINENDEVHWEDRIELEFDPDSRIDPLTFSRVITRECKQGVCKTVQTQNKE
jgi:hypothetical protein